MSKRINAITTTATSYASDDYLVMDGATNNTRKILTSSLMASPGPIGSGTPSSGAFTSLSATSTIVAPAATTSIASLRMPHGTAPTSPTNGDIWTTTAGVFARINGVTQGPLGAADLTSPGPIGSATPGTGQFTDLAAASPFTLRNAIINGDFGVDQRNAGSAVTLTTTVKYNQDRWATFAGSAVSGTLQSQQVAGDGASRYALRLSRTSGTYTGYLAIVQAIESINCYLLAGKTVTVSFRARKGSSYSATGISVAMRTGTGADQGAAGAVAGTWTGYATTSVTLTGTLGTSFSTFYGSVSIPSGTTEIALLFTTGNFSGTGDANDYIEITDIQLEIGSLVTPFERLPIDFQVRQCERYCEVWENRGGGAFTVFGMGAAYSDTNAYVFMPYRAAKRIVPTVTVSSASHFGLTASAGACNPCTAVGSSWRSKTSMHIAATVNSGVLAAGDAAAFMASNTTSALITIDAEL